MNWQRILTFGLVEARRQWRDWLSLLLLVIVPALQLLLFGFAITPEAHHVPIAISGSNGRAVQALQHTLAGDDHFRVILTTFNSGDATAAVQHGTALIGIELSNEDAFETETPSRPTRVVVDQSNPQAVGPALALLERDYWRRNALLLQSRTKPPKVEVERLYNPQSRSAWSFAPALIGVTIMISMLMFGALSLVREREQGTWEPLRLMPATLGEILIGKMLPYILMALVQALTVLVAARLLFDLPLRGDVWALLLLVVPFAAAHLGLGFLLSALARGQMQAVQSAVGFYLPSMLLSGFLYPFAAMPHWAQWLGWCLPLTYFVHIARAVLLKGATASLVLSQGWPILLFALLVLAAAVRAAAKRWQAD